MNKNNNWLLEFYKDNVKYVWVVLSLIIVSGFTIGISIGKIIDNNALNNDIIAIDEENNENNSIGIIEDNNIIANTEIIEKNLETKETVINAKKEDIAKEQSIPVISMNIEPKERKLEFISPIEGEVYREFTEDSLVFSDTLNEWISHMGIDIYGNQSTPVKAIESGKVIEVKNDPRYGYIIIIDHGQGYKSTYCNLSTLDMVFIDKYVEKGQVISGIGNTALFEIKDNSHLHFELEKDDILVNPLKYIVR